MSYKDYKLIKNKYRNYLLFEKQNNYYYVYDDDSTIINNFFKYKYNCLNSIKRVFIPDSNFNNIIDNINSKNINYIIYKQNNIIKEINYIDNNYSNVIDIIKDNNNVKRDLIILISKKLNKLNYYQVESILDFINDKY